MELEKVIQDMQAQGASNEQILQSLSQMVQEGKLTPEDLEKAKQLLGQGEAQSQPVDEEAEKAEASKLFGMKLM